MNKKVSLLKLAGIAAIIILAGFVAYRYYAHSISIKRIELKSPNNYAFQEEVNVVLDKEAAIEIRYWKEGSSDKYRTRGKPRLFETARLLRGSVQSKPRWVGLSLPRHRLICCWSFREAAIL